MFDNLHILYIIVQSISNLRIEHYTKQLVGAKYFVRKMSSARSFLHPKSTGEGPTYYLAIYPENCMKMKNTGIMDRGEGEGLVQNLTM